MPHRPDWVLPTSSQRRDTTRILRVIPESPSLGLRPRNTPHGPLRGPRRLPPPTLEQPLTATHGCALGCHLALLLGVSLLAGSQGHTHGPYRSFSSCLLMQPSGPTPPTPPRYDQPNCLLAYLRSHLRCVSYMRGRRVTTAGPSKCMTAKPTASYRIRPPVYHVHSLGAPDEHSKHASASRVQASLSLSGPTVRS